ncbi:MAG: formyltransferase family protein [Candidatus Parcubacteria bacterium]|nr:formyltransferase family protein [Candidatus Parcubacteria bacterium]
MEEKLLVFASGDAEGGGSGFQELVENSRSGILQAKIVAVVSNHKNGGVAQKAKNMGIQFLHFPGPFTADAYQQIWHGFGQPWVALSGWIKFVKGLPVRDVLNIHPAPLPGFGGQSWYGHSVHERVITAFKADEITNSAVCMHFVTEKYDDPSVLFFKYPILIRTDDDADSLGKRVNKIEHGWQSVITDLVVTRQIRFQEGAVIVPDWYKKMPFCPDNCQAYPKK